MKRYIGLLVVLASISGAAGLAAADAGPLADAGLDQRVDVDTTVQLDGTGSAHPNGTIDSYAWSIETPDGRHIQPACPDCARTQFTPHEPGRYDVTVTVTDTDGRSERDTLYVYVEDAGPTVELDGDTEPTTGEPTTYTATAGTSTADLAEITWRIDNRTVAEESLEGTNDRSTRSLTFTDSEPRRLEVVVRDAENRTASDVLLVDPQSGGGSSVDPPADGPARSSTDTERRPDERNTSDCINGVFVEGNAGCIGHISDAGHAAQGEGCEEDFCGVENPAKDTDTSDVTPDKNSDNEPGYEFGEYNGSEISSKNGEERRFDNSHVHARGGGNGNSGYISV
jgi:hypothetical protein